jgi:hypothetical protein
MTPNASLEPRLEAGARHERTLETVRCMPWLASVDGLSTLTTPMASPTLSWPQLLHESLMPFNVIHDLLGPPIARTIVGAVSFDDLLQLLFTVKLEIDHLHNGHQVEVVLHDRLFILVSLQEC